MESPLRASLGNITIKWAAAQTRQTDGVGLDPDAITSWSGDAMGKKKRDLIVPW